MERFALLSVAYVCVQVFIVHSRMSRPPALNYAGSLKLEMFVIVKRKIKKMAAASKIEEEN